MPVEIKYLGWSAFRFITENGTRIVMDPFLEGTLRSNIPPVASVKDLSDTHVIIVTHAARDHAGQVLELMKTSEATLFCARDVAMQVLKEGIPSERVYYMVPGIRFKFLDIHIKALAASHISISEFEGHWLTGIPLCFIVDLGPDGKIFFGGDNALGMHYRFIGELHQPDLAILGIGGSSYKGQYRRDLPPDEASVATKWLNAKAVIPMHYVSNEPQEFQKELVKNAPEVELAIMKPGERLFFNRAQGLMRKNDQKLQ